MPMPKPGPRQQELYNQICGMYHYKETMQRIDVMKENNYTAAAVEVLVGSQACAFDSNMDMWEEEVVLNARSTMTNDDNLEMLIASFDCDPDDYAAIKELIFSLLNRYSG